MFFKTPITLHSLTLGQKKKKIKNESMNSDKYKIATHTGMDKYFRQCLKKRVN